MTDVPRETVPVRLTPDGRVVARILHGMPKPWVAISGGAAGQVLEVETYDDDTARGWRQFSAEPLAASGAKRRRWRDARADVSRGTLEP